MKAQASYSSMVIGFPDDDVAWQSIANELESDVGKIFKTAKLIDPIEWNLWLHAIFTNAREVLVSKNRVGTLPSCKAKEIVVVVPVPYVEVISWGVDKKCHVYGVDHYDKLMKNFYPLGVDFGAFSDRTEYIRDSFRRGIRHSLNTGFTINKLPVKFDSSQTKVLEQ